MSNRVVVFPNKGAAAWMGVLMEEGLEQSLVKITEGPIHMVGMVQYLPNDHWKRISERKNSGPGERRVYDQRTGAKTKENVSMNDETGGIDYVARYNELVAEAVELGLTAKPIATRFRDAETGAKRCEALAKAIEDQRAKIASGEVELTAPPAVEEEVAIEPPPARKERKGMKKATTKKKAKATVPKKRAITKRADAGGGNSHMAKIAEEFRVGRPGTLREKALTYLSGKKNKAVQITELYRQVYNGKPDEDDLGKLKVVMLDLSARAGRYKLPYTLTLDGRGKDATITLGTKSGR